VSQLKRAVVFAVLALTALAGSFAGAHAQQQGQRLALVVGQSAYEGRPLATAANDAGLIAQALTSAGFEVIQGRDLNANDLRRVVRDFLDKAQTLPDDAAVAVYLSGYGLQLEGENYLLPVDARIQRDVDVPIDGFRLSDLVRSLERTPAQARIIVADMTREYPLPAGSDPLARGLALMEPPAGFLIAFSSAPNITNGDAPGPYGHYATALAEMMRQPGAPVDEVFNRVRLRTHETTKGLQTPWHKANLGSTPFVFFEPEESASAPPPVREVRRIEEVPAEEAYNIAVERDTIQDYQAFLRRYPDHPLARRVSAMLAARREAIVWRQTVTRNTSEAYWTYLRRYPNGPHAADSRRRLARLSAPVAPPPAFEEIVYEDLPPPLPEVERIEVVEVVTIIHDAPPPPRPPVYLLPEYEEDVEFVTIIREPPPPPVMVGVLPIPAPLPLPRYARPPRYYYEPIAPVTPRGPVAIPVRAPGVAGPLFGRPGEPRPPRGLRPEPVVPRQPGLAAEPQPIPVATRPPVARRPGVPVLPAEGRAPLPSRPIPLNPVAPRPGSAAPVPPQEGEPVATPQAPRPRVPVARPTAPTSVPQDMDRDLVARPTAPQPARPPSAQPPRQALPPVPRVPQPSAPVTRPGIPRPSSGSPVPSTYDEDGPRQPGPAVQQPRPAPRAVIPQPVRPTPRVVTPQPVRPSPPPVARPTPAPAAPQFRPQPRPVAPAPVPQFRQQARPVPDLDDRPSAPPVMRPQPMRPSPPPMVRPSPPPMARPAPAPAPAPVVRPQPVRPAAPAQRPNRGSACPPGKLCIND